MTAWRARSFEALASRPQWRAWLLFLRFGIVGLLNAAFGYAMFALLLYLSRAPGLSLVLATFAGAAFNFQTSRRLVFRLRGRAVRFVAVYAVMLAINSAALWILRGLGLADLEAQALLVLPMAVLSFLCQRRFVFGQTGQVA